MIVADNFKIESSEKSFSVLELKSVEIVTKGKGTRFKKTGKFVDRWIDHKMYFSKFINALNYILNENRLATVKQDIKFKEWAKQDAAFKQRLDEALEVYNSDSGEDLF